MPIGKPKPTQEPQDEEYEETEDAKEQPTHETQPVRRQPPAIPQPTLARSNVWFPEYNETLRLIQQFNEDAALARDDPAKLFAMEARLRSLYLLSSYAFVYQPNNAQAQGYLKEFEDGMEKLPPLFDNLGMMDKATGNNKKKSEIYDKTFDCAQSLFNGYIALGIFQAFKPSQ